MIKRLSVLTAIWKLVPTEEGSGQNEQGFITQVNKNGALLSVFGFDL
jgi:hypothetical protein